MHVKIKTKETVTNRELCIEWIKCVCVFHVRALFKQFKGQTCLAELNLKVSHNSENVRAIYNIKLKINPFNIHSSRNA